MQKKIRLQKVAMIIALIGLECIGWSAGTDQRQNTASLFTALRNGDFAAARSVQTSDVNAVNADGETPLMYAALYADAPTVALLLERGAKADAKTPAGTTALMLATGDLAKVRVLVEHGADVNAHSVTGRTPLLMAASRNGAGKVVQYLLAHGADPKVKDQLQGMPVIPAGGGGSTALIEAAKIRDGQALRALVAAGADIQALDNTGADALAAAALYGNLDNVRLLLAHGANADRRVTPSRVTPLIFAAWRQDAEMAKLLLSKGADVNAQDAAGSTALMWSAFDDYARTPTTAALLAAGAKVNTRNSAGQTALAWARQRGNTAVVKLLEACGAEADGSKGAIAAAPAADATPLAGRDAIEKSIALLQQSGPQFFKVSGCVSCHNQSLPQVAQGMARSRGMAVDERIAGQQLNAVLSVIKPARLPLLEMSDVVPDLAATGGYLMLGLEAERYAPDSTTDAVALNLAAKQFPDGSWRPWAPRPPLEFSPVSATALTLRVLQIYGPPARRVEMEQRVASARQWLRNVKPRTNEEKAMRLLGLAWSKAPQSDIDRAAKELAADQRTDGGWAQLATLGPDAYATGQALYALRMVGGMTAADPAFRRGAAYLLRSQQDDGSWHVITRVFPFQPYKESGFPHGKDQWISAAGTSWATMALLLGDETVISSRN